EVAARRLCQPWLDRSGKAASQAQAIGPETNERLRQGVDVCAGKLQQLDRDRISLGGMLDDLRRECREILRQRAGHPIDDGVRVRSKFRQQRAQQRRPCDATVAGPQRAAQCLAPEPGAASFVGDGPTPAADPMLPPIELGPADAAGADHDDAAVASAMGADAGGLGIGDEYRAAVGVLMLACRLELARLAGPRPW